MKTLIILILLTSVFLFATRDSVVNQPKFYYSYDDKIPLAISDNKLIVRYLHNKKSDIKRTSLQSELTSEQFKWIDDSTCIISVSIDKRNYYLETIRNKSDVKTCNPIYITEIGKEIGLTDEFLVCFKENIELDSIKELFNKYEVKVLKFGKHYLLLQAPKGSDALEIANKFQESGLTRYSYPHFIDEGQFFQVFPNDPFFSNQYHLHNSGQIFTDGHSGTPDADIDAPEAWSISKGCNDMIIAVIDQGVTSNHPDLPNTRQVRLPGSFIGGVTPDDPSPVLNVNHGNMCAGVIAATMNNSQGVVGVAPNCKIMPIRIPFVDEIYCTDAIDFAVEHGADIISCSWGFESDNPNYKPMLKDAIVNATTHGRHDNLGCVVVFAIGNNLETSGNGYIHFPSNVNVNGVLSVGSSDRDDKKAFYSPLGNPGSSKNQLIDLVAPSNKATNCQIPGETSETWSIDIPNDPGYNPIHETGPCGLPENGSYLPISGVNYTSYTGRCGGTSFSCPQVAGVAALMLSINPNLSQQQVFDIITSTADKVGGYQYVNGRSNELGFGRLNASRAVNQVAYALSSITGDFLVCFTGTKSYIFNGLPQGCSIIWEKSSNLNIVSQTSNTVTVSTNGSISGAGWIRGTINSPCGYTIEKPLWIGRFESTFVTGTPGVCPNSLYTYTALVPGGHSSSYTYTWTYPTNWYKNSQYQNTVLFQTPLSPQYGAVRVSITNACGTSGYSGITVYPGSNCGGYFLIYPNPAGDEINIEINESALSNVQGDTLGQFHDMVDKEKSFEIRIYNNIGFLIKSMTKDGFSFSIAVGELMEGNYVLELNDGKMAYRERFIIKR